MLRTMALLASCLLSTLAQNSENLPLKGAIYGTAVRQDGKPAKGIQLTARPMGALGAMLPLSRTNDRGEYRFENLLWWGGYTVYADDEEAGYSLFSTGSTIDLEARGIQITPNHPKAKFDIRLPPPAGFLRLHVIDSKTQRVIPAMEIKLMTAQDSPNFVLRGSCSSDHVILIPPGKSFLLHVTSPGYSEWADSTGHGKAIRVSSGDHVTFEVRLEARSKI